MFNSPIDEIKNRLDIVAVIGSYIKLQKAGANYRAVCPFHSEQKPSFFVSPARQIWHCFGCSLGGDIFRFVMQIERLEFSDALHLLAQKAGVELKKEDPKLKTERQRLYEICELAARFFEKQLELSKSGKEAEKYLLSRGIKANSIKEWRIGYAPDNWQGLSDFLVSKGYKKEEMVKAGLCIKNEAGSYYDRFRGRIIFPIFDPNSQVIGFGGRIFGPKSKDEIAKYVNSPNTLLYDKSRVLYGLHNAKEAIRKNNSCILVEGYTDVIMVSQAGYKDVVATSGTALAAFQLRTLKRYTENLLTAFDMDIAGDSATKRGIDLAQSLGFSIKVITMPEGSDPADIIFRDLQGWEKLTQEAKSILGFYFDTTFSKFNSREPEGKKEIGKILLPILKRLSNKIEQSFWIQELARKLEVKEESIEEELKKVKEAEPAFLAPAIEDSEVKQISPQFWQGKKSRKDLLEEQIVISIFRSPENLEIITEKEFAFFSSPICQVLDCLRKSQPLVRQVSNEAGDFQFEVIKNNVPAGLVGFLDYLTLKSEVEEMTSEELGEECKKCLKEIKILEIKNKLDEFSSGIKNAERENNLEKVQALLDQFHLCSKSLHDLESA